jgi:hypothetical protein
LVGQHRADQPSPSRPPLNVTEHPAAHWTAQQIVQAFPDDTTPSHMNLCPFSRVTMMFDVMME